MFSMHPNIYKTGQIGSLLNMLEDVWIKNLSIGDGTIFIISGFSNFNGGARFYRRLKEHTEAGGKVVVLLGGSSSQRLSSKEIVSALLDCGAEVFLINRKRLLHAKCYGWKKSTGENSLVISSGNFTGPGMSLNIEASAEIDHITLNKSGFDWDAMIKGFFQQNLQIHQCTDDVANPCWNLLYSESDRKHRFEADEIDDDDYEALIVTLGHADTVRIKADVGSNESKGSQYFWLSKDCFDFFPPLTLRNSRGIKGTLSCLIELEYLDIGITDSKARVTFEAENNLDFRLGTGKFRNSKTAEIGDIACIIRKSHDKYSIKIVRQNSKEYNLLDKYAINYTGHQGKRYGFIPSSYLKKILGIK